MSSADGDAAAAAARDVRIVDRDPQNISDPRTDCRSFVDKHLRTRILILH